MKKIRILSIAIFLISYVISADSDAAIRRYGLFIGSNEGGPDRTRLLYAASDARAMADVMYEIGGLMRSDGVVLTDPDSDDIRKEFGILAGKINEADAKSRRIEFILYYSGHSDDTGLLLGEDHIDYSELRDAIIVLNADVNIAILDSCSSGSFTRLKGGTRKPPFLVDESIETTGHAYLTSSSENEAAQESDSIQSSFFTHFFISALRGAADATRDGVVTLHEAYSYASTETLNRTENTEAGAQHPSYDIKMTGSGGDLVLTDLRASTSQITFREEIEGTIFIRDSSSRLAAEIRKQFGVPSVISVPPGTYTITLKTGNDQLETTVNLKNNDFVSVHSSQFARTDVETTRFRGTRPESTIEETVENILAEIRIPFQVSLLSIPVGINRNSTVNFAVNLIGSDYRIDGVELGLLNFVTDSMKGYQGAGILNIVGNEMKGVQTAGIFNINNGKTDGLQASGVFNISRGDVNGGMVAGIFNLADQTTRWAQAAGVFNINAMDINGFQGAGVFNINSGKGKGFQGAGVFNINAGNFLGFQGAGVFNINHGGVSGYQGAGVFNVADIIAGVQTALLNISGDVSGVQFGLVNIGDYVHGTQIGLLNINKDISGIPLGLINISVHGLHDFSLWYTENENLFAGFQLGTKNLYSLLYLGVPREGMDKNLVAGAGGGIRIPIGPFYLETDISIRQYSTGINFGDMLLNTFDTHIEKKTVLPAVRLIAGFKLGNISIFGGLSTDIHIPGSTYKSETYNGGNSYLFKDDTIPLEVEFNYNWFGGFSL